MAASPTGTEGRARRRAGMTLAGIAIAVIAVIALVIVMVTAHSLNTAAAPPPPAVPSATTAAGDTTAAEENALAARPMLQLPAQAAQPQTLTTQTAGPPITVLRPDITTGQWIPGGFPATVDGALGQLLALDETTLSGGDPQVYARGYRETSQPGSPDPRSTGLYSLLTSMRSHAGLTDTGPVLGLTVTYHVVQAQVKGTAAGGTYAVVCVLGQLSVTYQGQTISAGVGDCQAMTWTGATWRVAPGPLAAPAPSAWPGSADAVKAGYRRLT